MSCCGSQRTALRQAAASYRRPERGGSSGFNVAPSPAANVEFEYAGYGQRAVTGPLTGARYHFGAHGARALVHAPDVPSLALMPGLRPVR